MTPANDSAGLSDSGTSEGDAAPQAVAVPYRSARRRANAVIALFAAGILLNVASFAGNLHAYWLMQRVRTSQPYRGEEIKANDLWQAGIMLLWPLWFVAIVVAFLMWVHRAHRNLRALGAQNLEFSPRGAVGWYFVPFLNLFKPYQVMREIYNASEPVQDQSDNADWRRRNAPAVVKLWWASFLLMNLVGNAVMRASAHADTAGAFQFLAAVSMGRDAITVIAILAAIWLVRSVTRRQESRAALLELAT